MTESAESVATGEITQAVRDSKTEVGQIATGRLDGHRQGRRHRRRSRPTVDDAARKLLEHCCRDDGELLTVITGADADRVGHGGRSRPGWPTSTPTSSSRSTRAASRSTRTCSASSRHAARERPARRSPCANWAAIDVGQLKGVGEKKRASLAAFDIFTVLDLVTTYPRRWVDRTNEARIADLVPGEEALVLVTIQRRSPSARTRNRRTMVNVNVGDGSGRMDVVFFNQPWRERQLQEGLQVALFGKADTYRGRPPDGEPDRRSDR